MQQAKYHHIDESQRDIIYPIFLDSEICPCVIETLGYNINEIVDKRFNQITKVYTLGKYPFKTIIFIGLGHSKEITTAKMREAFTKVAKEINLQASFNAESAVTKDIDIHKVTQLFVESYLLGTYQEVKVNGEPKEVSDVNIMAADTDVQKDIEVAQHYAEGINHAKDLANSPANIMTPKQLTEIAKNIAQTYHLEYTVLDEKELEKMGAGAILAVAKGSKEKPYLICLKYTGTNEDEPYTALIGKGITFDSGGYNLKANSYGMKYDMSGAADVLGAMEIIAANKMEANVYCIVPTTENLVNGLAYKPQDVITTLSGKTVEIVSTDAEGRLILCDAITYAQMLGAKYIIDIATLTGACMRALGGVYAGVFTNSDAYYQKLTTALNKSDEKGWRLPIGPEYLAMIQSSSADLKNSSGKPAGGASVAGSFLASFVHEDVEWLHLDIAGMAQQADQGATGAMIRTMAKMFE